MPTNNDERLVIYCDELRSMIRKEVERFREQLNTIVEEVKRGQQLDAKPLSISQVAERYGVSKATVHNWMNQKLIEGFKQGKGRFFYLHELDQSLTRYKYFEMLQNTGEIPQNKRYMEYQREREQ